MKPPRDEERAAITRRDLLKWLGAGAGLLVIECGEGVHPPAAKPGEYDPTKHRWGYAIEISKCIGCCACMRACRDENQVPEGHFRTWIERYHIHPDGSVQIDTPTGPEFKFKAREDRVVDKAFFVPKKCNHCATTPCTQVCPVGASYETEDGVVLVDGDRCVGCGYCVQACPYGSRFIDPATHTASKCTLCYHRITKGELPACVLACPTGTRIFGDMKDPNSEISRVLKRYRHRHLKPELGTSPRTYYIGLEPEVV